MVTGWARVPSGWLGWLTTRPPSGAEVLAVADATGSLLETVTVIRVVSPLDARGTCCGHAALTAGVTVMTGAAAAGGGRSDQQRLRGTAR
jgi:hypothetical protein